MILTCPQCETAFDLPDAMYRPGRKARCSSCGTVFAMPGPVQAPVGEKPLPPPEAPLPAAPQPQKKRRQWAHSLVAILLIVVSVIGLCIGGYMIFGPDGANAPKSSPVPAASEATPAAQGKEAETPEGQGNSEALAELAENISLKDVRQFVVKNDKLGSIVVIQGTAVNNFATPKEMIAVEAHLLDANDTVLDVARQRAGVSPTLLQLTVSNAGELEAALNNPVDILLNNSNVPPKGEVPFCIVFTKQPQAMAAFEVRPIDAQDVQAQGK